MERDYPMVREQAFLMIHLDITKNPPEIYRVGTYSNKEITTFLGREIVVPILVGYGTDYAEGLAHLRKRLLEPHHKQLLSWCSDQKVSL